MDEIQSRIIIVLVSSILGGYVTLRVAKIQRKETSTEKQTKEASVIATHTGTLALLVKQVDDLVRRDNQKEQRINSLERELRKYVNAYARAVRYIFDTHPGAPMPNFLIDTAEIMNGKDGRNDP